MKSNNNYTDVILCLVATILIILSVSIFEQIYLNIIALNPQIYNRIIKFFITDRIRDPNKWYEVSPGIMYKGEWLNDVPHGNGIAEYLENTDHSFVIGNFVNGHIQGRAIRVYDKDKQGDKIAFYEGDFVNSKEHGNGMYQYSNGSCYIGEFRNDYFEGNGTYTSARSNDITHGIYKENNCVEVITVRNRYLH